ncbi:SEC14-like protein 1 [Chanodichthys erythropterus]|uniref:SEC14-like protein 1 n=1 Tax=Chanodichthys erythropterus TaxID=933992 RepID=UPI00351DD5AE
MFCILFAAPIQIPDSQLGSDRWSAKYVTHYEININPFIHFQVLIEITDVSSVITWDFDVCKGDVIFNIYHSRRAPQPAKRDGLSTHNLACPAGNNVQLIERSWMLGQDYSMVETALTCREGESVQGSHVTRWPGFYILQWRLYSTPTCTSSSRPRVDDVLASLQVSSHKCKVMYFTEVLQSQC